MSQLNVDTIKKADGTGSLTVPAETGTVVTTAGATFTGAVAMGANNISFSNGNGIDFSASEGSGASSSILEDYEEGTFSPALQAVSASTNSGAANYVKIGQMVFCRGYIEWSGLNTGDASAFQFGLPFTADTSDSGGSGSVAAQFTMDTRYTTGFTGDLPDVHGARVIGGTFVLTRLETDFAYNNGVDASGAFVFHFSYRATT